MCPPFIFIDVCNIVDESWKMLARYFSKKKKKTGEILVYLLKSHNEKKKEEKKSLPVVQGTGH